MKIGFVTCVQLGLTCMEALYDAGASLDVIFTLHDHIATKKSGRIYVDDFAEQRSVPIVKLEHVNDAVAVREYRNLDWLFIVGWSQIAGPSVIDAPTRGVVGIHPTLLPEGRGRASIPWAILKGLSKTGVTLFKLDDGVDTGPIIAQKEIRLERDATATMLYDSVCQAHAELIRDTVPKMLTDSVVMREQDESLASVWPGRNPDDGEIDLRGSVHDAERLVRAVTKPYPGAYYLDDCGRKVIVWKAHICKREAAVPILRFKDGLLAIDDHQIIDR